MLSTYQDSRVKELDACFTKGFYNKGEKAILTDEMKDELKGLSGIEYAAKRVEQIHSLIHPEVRKPAIIYYMEVVQHLISLTNSKFKILERDSEILFDALNLSSQAYSMFDRNLTQADCYNRSLVRDCIIGCIKMIFLAEKAIAPEDRYSRETLLTIREATVKQIRVILLISEIKNDPEINELLDTYVEEVQKKESWWRKLFP